MSLSWKVLKVTDHGRGQHYRYHVEGLVLDDGAPPRPFFWGVPSLDDPTYDLTEARMNTGERFTARPERAEEEP